MVEWLKEMKQWWETVEVEAEGAYLLPVASPPRTGVVTGNYGDVPIGTPVITQESPGQEYL